MASRGASIRTKKYERFRGVDFSTDPALVDDARSPYAPNMWADMGGMPEKRPGWRTLQQVEGRINGLFHAKFGGTIHTLAHAGTTLLRWYLDETEPETLAEGLPDERSTAVFMAEKLWIFTGAKLLSYDGKTAEDVSEHGYVPTTVIARSPGGGGVSYESINLMSPWQTVRFLADGTSRVYVLPYENVDELGDVVVDGEIVPEDTGYASKNYTFNAEEGTVTFMTAPGKPAAGAEDNVYITFKKTFAGYSDRIGKCRFAVVWGVNGLTDRIIASGNPDRQNQDFISGFSDGSYWPDLNYAVIGTEETAVMGYRRLGDSLAVIKEDNGQDSTIFIRTAGLNSAGEATFTIRPCISGAGAVSRFGFGNIGDEQLLLTGGGVYALTTNSFTAERVTQNRSFRVDPLLRKELLSDAVSCNWENCYLVFVSGNVYGLDGRQQKNYPSRNDTAFLYECFFWDNVPARSVMNLIDGGTENLFFGTEDGRICRFNTDVIGMEKFSDDGEAITAIWSTKMDDDGDPMIYKTLLKKGNAVTIKPYARSSAKILFRTDRDADGKLVQVAEGSGEWQVAEGFMDIFSWEDIDFGRFTFNSNDGPQEIPFNRRVKNYKRLQIAIKNDVANEGFGVYCIVKHYVTGNFAKR